MTIKCDKCGKTTEEDNLVWFTFRMPETHLCNGCYATWNKAHREFVEDHKKVKAMTQAWTKMCEEETKLFQDWLKKQKKPILSRKDEQRANEMYKEQMKYEAKLKKRKATKNGKKKTKAHRNH